MNRVIKQAKGFLLGGLAQASRNYNASVTEHDGRRWMAYRHEPQAGELCQIRIAELDDAWRVHRDELVTIPHSTGDNLEDPRLFLFLGGLWLAWTAAQYGPKGWTCRQHYGRLERTGEGWHVVQAFAPRFGKNDGKAKEKNWQFFEHGGRLFAQYEPHHVIEIEGDIVRRQWRSRPLPWRWGRPSGGTPPVPFSPGKLITFFHAYEHDANYQRRYNMAALVIEDRPPFRHLAVSAVPLVVASENDRLPDDGWRPLCVFPCGAFRKPSGAWVVSLGINDMDVGVVSFRPHELHLTEPNARPKLTGDTARVRVLRPILAGGNIVVPPAVVEIPRRSAETLIARRSVIPLSTYTLA
jgi:predicted GH43/DUF377 family glycosyl hydrolase